MKCIVCGKEGAVEIHIVDGYMAGGKFNTCPTRCYREIVSKGVAFWEEKVKEEGKVGFNEWEEHYKKLLKSGL